ncbi:MAG: ATP-binding protein [Bacteroidia bacterium]
MRQPEIASFLKSLTRNDLLRIAREARENNYIHLRRPLTHLSAEELRSVLLRRSIMLRFLSSFQELWRQHRREPSKARESTPPLPIPSYAELKEKLFPDVLGMDEVKEALITYVYLPLTYAKIATEYQIPAKKGIVLVGPPGNGKTYICKKFAQASGFTFFRIETPSLANKWYGETERRIRMLFRKAAREAPAILYFDEIESLFAEREKMSSIFAMQVAQFLTAMDNVSEETPIAIIGSTNRIQALDPAILRPGRLSEIVHVTPPDAYERLMILKLYASRLQLQEPIPWDKLVEKTDGYSRSALIDLIRKAATKAWVRHLHTGQKQKVNAMDFLLDYKK